MKARAAGGHVARIRTFVSRRTWLVTLPQRLLDRYPVLQDRFARIVVGDSQQRYARWVAKSDTLLVYGDDDSLDAEGLRSDHQFKPDWNEALLRAQNYIGGVVCCSRAQTLAVGGCDDDPDGELLWGLFLRLTAGAAPETIRHV